MSNIQKRKGKPPSGGGLLKPEDVAIKPKPPMHAKRTHAPSPGTSTSKKIKLDVTQGISMKPVLDMAWLDFCGNTTINIGSFADVLNSAFKEQKSNKAAKLIASAFRLFVEKKLDAHKILFEYHLVTTCTVAVKEHGEKLQNLYLHKCFLSMLTLMKTLAPDRQELIAALATVLAEKQTNLDQYYYTAFLQDALGDRNWVDKPICARLVALLLRPFSTCFPSREAYVASQVDLVIPEISPSPDVPNKFAQSPQELAEPILDCLGKWLATDPPPRNVVRTLSLFSGISEVRRMVAEKIDTWCQNGKLQRHALELLLFVGCNFGAANTSENDRKALPYLLKMRCLKSKQVLPVFTAALKDLISRDESNLREAISLIVKNEFSQVPLRYTMNAILLNMLFNIDNVRTTRVFAEELSRIVISCEDLTKAARLLVREVFRSLLKTDFNFPMFAEAYLNIILEEAFRSELGINEYVFRSAVEVITMLPLVSIFQNVREAASLRRNGGLLPPETQNTLSRVEKDFSTYFDVVLKWLQNAKQFMEYKDYVISYYRFLFLEQSDYYTSMDQGPTEGEFMHANKIFGEFRFTDYHFWLIVGEKFNTLTQDDTINILYEITKRSIGHRIFNDDRPLLSFVSPHPASELVGRILEVCLYRPPFMYNDSLVPMFVKSVYWKSWILLVLWICIGKPTAALQSVYENFPMFRLFVHMILTKQYSFPLPFDGKSEEEISNMENEECLKETEALVKQENLFQKTLNLTADVTEFNSQLLQTCCLARNDVMRRPPDGFLGDLKTTSTECQLVASLCGSRNPDLLKNLIDAYGSAKAMPAVQDFIISNPAAIESLSVLVLTEFMLYYFTSDGRNRASVGDDKIHMVGTRLRSFTSKESDVLLFVLKRLSSSSAAERMSAHNGLRTLTEEYPVGDSPALFEYSRLLKVGCFQTVKCQLAIGVAKSLAFELDPSRVADGVSFILKTTFVENMHEVSLEMSRFAARGVAVFNTSVLKFFEKYHTLCASKNFWSDDMDVSQRYIVKMNSGDTSMLKDAVTATLQLLCKSGKETSAARNSLINIWFPTKGKRPAVVSEAGELDVLTESLRSDMLCAEDERINKLALQNVKGPAAVHLLSSFGLTNFSSSQLLAAVDKLSISDVGKERAVAVRPFIVAYRKRGAKGGEKFLASITYDESEDVSMKNEQMDEEVIYVPPPTHDQLILEENRIISKAEALKILKQMTSADSPLLFICPTKLMRCALQNKDVALACVAHFEDNLKFFLANSTAFHEILMLLSNSADRFDEVRDKVTSLSTRLLKSAAVRPPLDGYLRKFSATPTKKAERKPFGCVKNMSPCDILETLNKTAVVNASERARLLNAFLEKRPEVIERTLDVVVLDKQLLAVFAGRNGVDGLVPQIHLRAPPETVITILRRLLLSFDVKLNPVLVCEFFGYCCLPEFAFLKSHEQLTVLGYYLAEMVVRDPKNNVKAISLLDKMVDVGGFDLLIPICNLLISMERSDQEKRIRTRVSGLLEDIQLKFPCVHVSPLSSTITIRGPKWRLQQGDRYCSVLVSNLFESEDNDEVARALDSLRQMLQTHPSLVAREFGVMASQLSVVLTKDSRDVKATNRRHTIGLVRQTAIALMPKLQKEDMPHVNTAIALLIAIFDRHVKGSPSETTLSEAIISLCYNYLEHHLESGREMLLEQGTALEEICAIHPDLPNSKAVREQIRAVFDAV